VGPVTTTAPTVPERAVLAAAGVVALLVGAFAMVAPVAFRSGFGIDLAGDVALANETRAAGGGLAAVGAVVLLGTVARALTLAAAVLGALVFGAYGVARLLSLALDGRPDSGLLVAGAVELVLAAGCAAVLLGLRRRSA
jgi:hypothetical protein